MFALSHVYGYFQAIILYTYQYIMTRPFYYYVKIRSAKEVRVRMVTFVDLIKNK